MKKVFLSLMVVLMGSLLTLPDADAQNRRGGRNAAGSSQSVSRPGRGNRDQSSSRPSSGNVRPGHNGGGNNSNGNYRPGNNGGGNRPGHGTATPPGSNNNYRPGNNGGDNRPGHGAATPPGGNHNYRPGHNGNWNRPAPPAVGHRPGHRPPVMAPPTRPGRPYYHVPWTRPLPPSGWRPVYRRPLISGFLGLSFGLTINTALDRLYDSGYSIDGYGSKEVYLRNVSELGYFWDDATLYFASGGLVRSQFFDSSAGYNPSRYNNVYMTLCNNYGAPVSRGDNSATWFGYNGDYITLQYTMMNTSVGYRYFTILTYGN